MARQKPHRAKPDKGASESSEAWGEYKDAQKERRTARLAVRAEQILGLREKGYDVRKFTDYQYRVNGVVDLYPTHNLFHDLKTGVRNNYQDAEQFVMKRYPIVPA